jgi:diguanylate cyclase (GGDEF) domain
MKSGRKTNPKFFLITERKQTWIIAFRLALIYLVFGLSWIIITDWANLHLILDPALQGRISLIKGFAFVFISALVIYLLVAPQLTKLSDNEQIILENRNELKVMLYYDHLTGLSNRRKLTERIPDYLNDSTSKGKALLFLDIDNIKLINDTMGHEYGDKLIVETARILSANIQPPDELYRIGGDELIILTKFHQISGLKDRAEGILRLFDKPLSIGNTLIHSTLSMGISLYPIHSTDPGELMKFADMAMYQSKKNGKNRAVLYNINMQTEINERMSIGEYLHDALQKNELEVYYQPQINTETRKITSYESLLRWNNHILGKVTPDKFIGIAEETHLIIPIGEWILRQSCQFLKKMHRQGYTNLTISVNISMIQLIQDDFVSLIDRVLAEEELDPSKLELEITESVLMESHSLISGHLNELRKRGIGIALDDFGKGYSSLNYLEKLPISTLKIDKTFIDGISEANKDTSITGNIVRIGKKLGLTVIAEGVETEIQLSYLTNQHCDKIQGWVFSKALCESDAELYTVQNLSGVIR